MLICPIHRCLCSAGNDCKCPKCEELGKVVVICEIDKISRVQDGMIENGYEFDRFSYAVLIYDKPNEAGRS